VEKIIGQDRELGVIPSILVYPLHKLNIENLNMEFKYNNLSYWFSDKESLADMLKREDILSFPLSVWKELLEHRYGLVNKDTLITVLKAKIEAYDISSSVNGFYVKGLNFWLDKATRVGLMHLANCSTNTI